MSTYGVTERERTASIAAAIAVHAAVAAVWLMGLAPRFSPVRESGLTVFDVPPPPPAVTKPPAKAARNHPSESKAAPPNLQADPKPVVAPVAIVPPPPQPITAPPEAAEGNMTSAGAAPTPGPGTGAGGIGDGLGSGSRGSGTGGGGRSARLIRGQITDRDYPRDVRRAKLGGSVTVRFTVQRDGRATGCSVTRSSGIASLDTTTCKLVEKRFRYAPALDAAGNPAAEVRGWRQTWWLEDETPKRTGTPAA